MVLLLAKQIITLYHAVQKLSTKDQHALENAAQGATLLLNSPHAKEDVWTHLPISLQKKILELDTEGSPRI